jgi:hypothetical protein
LISFWYLIRSWWEPFDQPLTFSTRNSEMQSAYQNFMQMGIFLFSLIIYFPLSRRREPGRDLYLFVVPLQYPFSSSSTILAVSS